MKAEEIAAGLTEGEKSVLLRMQFAKLHRGWSSTNWAPADHLAGQQLVFKGLFKDAGCWNWFWTEAGLAVRESLMKEKGDA